MGREVVMSCREAGYADGDGDGDGDGGDGLWVVGRAVVSSRSASLASSSVSSLSFTPFEVWRKSEGYE